MEQQQGRNEEAIITLIFAAANQKIKTITLIQEIYLN